MRQLTAEARESQKPTYPGMAGVEPPLDELFQDTILAALLTSDGIRLDDLRALVDDVRTRLEPEEVAA